MLGWCWSSVYDAGPTLTQHWDIMFTVEITGHPTGTGISKTNRRYTPKSGSVLTHRAPDVVATLNRRHWRWFNVATMSGARWFESWGVQSYQVMWDGNMSAHIIHVLESLSSNTPWATFIFGKSIAHAIFPSIMNRFPWNLAQAIFKSYPHVGRKNSQNYIVYFKS